MRTTLDIDPHLLQRLRDEAHRQGVPFKDLLTTVLRRGLDERPSRSASYRCPTYSMGTPADRGTMDKALRIAAQLEDDESARKIKMRK